MVEAKKVCLARGICHIGFFSGHVIMSNGPVRACPSRQAQGGAEM